MYLAKGGVKEHLLLIYPEVYSCDADQSQIKVAIILLKQMREPFGLSHFYFLLPPQHHDAAHIYTHLSKGTCDLKQNGTKKDSCKKVLHAAKGIPVLDDFRS